ncbi:PREDICTED: uncharacterized protein LOC107161896 [Diuraphis noxia]|uniref:uncharacterized protein LOC107161896 n=1 Tax=Diuraphis noxia TaxID=143948 RepID=UPI000763B6A1|nr:PREDICTED: uncharacterized protein LOC107161896 [Diuraphis noxia]
MLRIQFEVLNSSIKKYVFVNLAICIVLTYFNMMNSINYIAIAIIVGAMLKGNTNRAMPYSLFLTAIGCVFDIFSVLFRSTNYDSSSWAYVKFFHYIMCIFIFLYVIFYILMLYCYWLHSMAVAQKQQIRLQLGLYDDNKK